jgi:hypothetical protein
MTAGVAAFSSAMRASSGFLMFGVLLILWEPERKFDKVLELLQDIKDIPG